jgi:hypothetical protein
VGLEKHTAVVIDWYGPWRWNGSKRWWLGAGESRQSEFGRPGIYLAIQPAKQKWARYVGIATKSVYDRVHIPQAHENLEKIVGPFELWIGQVSNAPKSRSFLGAAEWAHAFGLQPRPALNVQKSKKPPHHRVTVLNLWWKDDHEQCRPPHKNWPNRFDLIYRGLGHLTMECWLGQRIRRFDCLRRNDKWEVKVK